MIQTRLSIYLVCDWSQILFKLQKKEYAIIIVRMCFFFSKNIDFATGVCIPTLLFARSLCKDILLFANLRFSNRHHNDVKKCIMLVCWSCVQPFVRNIVQRSNYEGIALPIQ